MHLHNHRAPIILAGQTYYDESKNAYLVVTKRQGEMVSYTGQPFTGALGFRGRLEDEDFITQFQPVDPADLTEAEAAELLSFCDEGTTLKTGYIKED